MEVGAGTEKVLRVEDSRDEVCHKSANKSPLRSAKSEVEDEVDDGVNEVAKGDPDFIFTFILLIMLAFWSLLAEPPSALSYSKALANLGLVDFPTSEEGSDKTLKGTWWSAGILVYSGEASRSERWILVLVKKKI